MISSPSSRLFHPVHSWVGGKPADQRIHMHDKLQVQLDQLSQAARRIELPTAIFPLGVDIPVTHVVRPGQVLLFPGDLVEQRASPTALADLREFKLALGSVHRESLVLAGRRQVLGARISQVETAEKASGDAPDRPALRTGYLVFDKVPKML